MKNNLIALTENSVFCRGLVNALSSTPAAVSSLGLTAAAVPASREPVHITIPQQRTVVDVAPRPLVSPMSTRPVAIGQQPALLQQQPGIHAQVCESLSNVSPSSSVLSQAMASKFMISLSYIHIVK